MIKRKLNIGLGLVISLSLFSCVSENEQIKGPFKDVINFKSEISVKSGGLIKTIETISKVETKTISSPDWKVELQPFVEANFNTPANKENYRRTETVGELSGWREVRWVSIQDKLPVKSAVYRFVDSTCIGAVIDVKKSTAAYSMEELLVYLPGAGYTINNQQDLSNINENSFSLKGEFSGAPQPWRMFFDIGPQNVPVNFYLSGSEEAKELKFVQGKESFSVNATKTDSGYLAEMPVFQSYILFDFEEGEMKGAFHNLDKGPDYIIPLHANKLPYEMVMGMPLDRMNTDFSGKWETYFYGMEDSSAAIGMFERIGNDLVGTFATETGDFRFLQGKVMGDSFSLSTFDGSHLFLFTGKINEYSISEGHFYSGSHHHQKWGAKRNANFQLADPNAMTQMNSEGSKIDFSFPNLKGELVSLSDENYQNKVIILQIMGSWCPNCMDETRYFNELYENYANQGLEIVGLAFERHIEFEKAKVALEKTISDLKISYPIVIAGTPRESAKALPMISPIKSYPTSIFINRKGEVVKIHTGFYGPSTGKYYEDYRAETETFIQGLLVEK